MAGTAAAVDYFAWIGGDMAGETGDRRAAVQAGIELLVEYEKDLSKHLVEGLQSLPGVTVQGITADEALDRRVPTVAFTHADKRPADIAALLGDDNIFVWSGHNYALETARTLGILETGGAVRIGPVHYNSVAEIDELIDSLGGILAS